MPESSMMLRSWFSPHAPRAAGDFKAPANWDAVAFKVLIRPVSCSAISFTVALSPS